jgi:hypothetical protein
MSNRDGRPGRVFAADIAAFGEPQQTQAGVGDLCPLWLQLKRNDFKLNHHFALASCLSMIFSEKRYPLFRIML